jgi:hypothetical protein
LPRIAATILNKFSRGFGGDRITGHRLSSSRPEQYKKLYASRTATAPKLKR